MRAVSCSSTLPSPCPAAQLCSNSCLMASSFWCSLCRSTAVLLKKEVLQSRQRKRTSSRSRFPNWGQARSGKLGNLGQSGQYMGNSEMNWELSNAWNIGQCIGYWAMYVIFGNIREKFMRYCALYGKLGYDWDIGHFRYNKLDYVGQCLGYWEMYRISGNVIYIQKCMGYWAMYEILVKIWDICQCLAYWAI